MKTGPSGLMRLPDSARLAIDEAVTAVVQVVAQSRPAHAAHMQVANKKEDPVTPVVDHESERRRSCGHCRPAEGAGRILYWIHPRRRPRLGAGRKPHCAARDSCLRKNPSTGPASVWPLEDRAVMARPLQERALMGRAAESKTAWGRPGLAGAEPKWLRRRFAKWRRRPATRRPKDCAPPGGRVNVETQGGANGLHGQGFFFDRQNTWGARNPFTQWITETAPATARRAFRSLAMVRTERRVVYPSRPRNGVGHGHRAARSAATNCSGSARWTAITATIQGWPR